ncbi:MAG: LTA synthase family protein, partial [Planctomycetes bacterium]|nr:LTA synthase family protein [Planctomycetota bacterium]
MTASFDRATGVPDHGRSTFWLCFWLATALALTKAVYLGPPPEWSWAGMIDYGSDAAIISHADVLYAVGIGLVGQTALCLSARRAQIERLVWYGLVLFCVVSVVYAIVSVQIFAYLRTPLTYPLIYLAGDMKNMRSSLGAFITPLMLAALVAGPVVYLVLAWATHRFVQPQRTRLFRVGQGLGLMVVLVYFGLVHRAYATGPWSERVDRRVADNPHWVLACSFLDAMAQPQLVQLDEEFRPECLSDFATLGERQSDARLNMPPLPRGEGRGEGKESRGRADSATQALTLTLSQGERGRPRNVIVYVLESVGAQYLSLYGSSYDTTPRLAEEAAHSLVFDNFYAHVGVTANSLVAINLSIYPGMTWREYTVEQPDLPGTTLAEILQSRGYRTAYMTSGEIQYVNMDGFLHNRGYDLVCGYEYLGCGALLVSWGVEDRCLVDSLLRWIDDDSGAARPFFVMAWTQQTHHPYEPSPGRPFIDFFKGRTLPPDDYDLGRYLNTLHEADRQLGRLFDELRRRGLADDTV